MLNRKKHQEQEKNDESFWVITLFLAYGFAPVG